MVEYDKFGLYIRYIVKIQHAYRIRVINKLISQLPMCKDVQGIVKDFCAIPEYNNWASYCIDVNDDYYCYKPAHKQNKKPEDFNGSVYNYYNPLCITCKLIDQTSPRIIIKGKIGDKWVLLSKGPPSSLYYYLNEIRMKDSKPDGCEFKVEYY